ncbi:hypothetical protein M0R04_00905 [Candidatus Dojkabacteria bacterium]|jgi:hypothetical protein|nr:hypothetical protein [Candidatus Dojkabacteria bacterium]
MDYISPELQEALIEEKVDIEDLSLNECSTILLNAAEGKPEVLYNILNDLSDLLFLRKLPEVHLALSLSEAQKNIATSLESTQGVFGYITGGLEGLHLSALLEGYSAMGVKGIMIGVEHPNYTSEKGRVPLFTMSEKMNLWKVLAPNNSIVFPIPKKPSDISPDSYYDFIANFLGLFGNEKIIYIGAPDDSAEVKIAHERRAYSPNHCLKLGYTFPVDASGEITIPVHVTDLLKSEIDMWKRLRGYIE